MRHLHLKVILVMFVFTAGILAYVNSARADSAEEINHDAREALQQLYEKSPSAKALGEKAKGILVFPWVYKGGFIVGGQYGEGALIKNGKTVGYYNTIQASYGLQAGMQKFGYALFFMNDSAMSWLDKSDGWELGTGPTIVVVDAGFAKTFSTTTLQSQIYAFFFNQKGLMAGIGLQGTKVTKLDK